jgi:two-component system copper resistance phosphate regulon response regulator CusR
VQDGCVKLLVLEDDVDLGPILAAGLREAGFVVDHVVTMADADLALSVHTYDCLVADRMVADGDSVDLVADLRARGLLLPVLLLTAMDAITDRVAGFEQGADDYLVKPFALAELVARVRALSRRGDLTRAPVLTHGGLSLDVPRHRVSRDGVLLTLTAKEFAVLEVLMHFGGDVVSRSELIDRCWDELRDPMSNVVDVLIGQLRRRLGAPNIITTVRGVGYRLATSSDEST